jgi:biotin carboxyl carrier protein
MKMQNLVYAPVAGTVKEVRVKPGDKIEGDAVLLIIE